MAWTHKQIAEFKITWARMIEHGNSIWDAALAVAEKAETDAEAQAKIKIAALATALWESRHWGDDGQTACWCPKAACKYDRQPRCVANVAALRLAGALK